MASFTKNFRQFPGTFWIANTMELFERWGYYGMFTVLSVYLTDPVSNGGLGFSQEQRGLMQALATGVLYLVPIIGGALADRFGFRKVLLAAFVTLSSGYLAMGHFNGYVPVFMSFLVVAIGGAIFKPIIVATVSKTAREGSDTLGFGIFYMIVNIGGFIGPFMASKLRDLDWNYVFYMCSGVILVNLLLLAFYREPGKGEKGNKEPLGAALRTTASNTVMVLKDSKFVLFLLIMAGFWTMYMQIFFTLPVYITQWIDTSAIYDSAPFLARIIGTMEDGKGIIRPEMILNIPAFTIICFQVVVSGLVAKVKPVVSIVFGAIIVSAGMGWMAGGMNGWIIVAAVVVIAFGEMISSPRIQEYSGRIAPKDKVALYMGYSFLPLAIGNIIGGLLSGKLYAMLSDKYHFAGKILSQSGFDQEEIEALDPSTLLDKAASVRGVDLQGLSEFLFRQYHPHTIWYVFGGIGLLTALALFTFNRFVSSGEEK